MTALLPRLRDEATKHGGTETGKLLAWAELHIGDQFDRITELEEDEERLTKECEQLRTAMNCFAELFEEAAKFLRSESYEVRPDVFARDLAPWRNMMAAHGMKQDGTAITSRKKKMHNAI